MSLRQLVLIRHGESTWNAAGRFTGWTDAALTETGVEQAHAAGRLLRDLGFGFDLVFTSRMRRAIHTAWIVLDELDALWVPSQPRWRLNERHFGKLEGLVIQDIYRDYGLEWLERWRADADMRPPLLDADDERHPALDARYRDVAARELPVGESVNDLIARAGRVFAEEIRPAISAGARVLVACHGNTVKALDELLRAGEGSRIEENPVPPAAPLVYEIDAATGGFVSRRYLRD
ncbi:MAG: 2,3-bisphosphoglycerate-dependent phosphoglycerate mutase [Bryobacteraceae bacterium]